MFLKSTFIKGTFVLTASSLITKFLGFFYRIFVSRIFTTEEIGLYQLVVPVFTLCYTLTSAGFQTALSKLTASHFARSRKSDAINTLKFALFWCISFSFVTMIVLQKNSIFITKHFLNNSRCASLIIAISYILPFSAIHSCISGYYLGIKKTVPIAISQLLEQLIRILAVILFYNIGLQAALDEPICIAVFGLVLGEIFASIYCMHTLKDEHKYFSKITTNTKSNLHSLFSFAIPLTSNRLLLNIMQSYEAISIPHKLIQSGLSNSDALSLYGVLTGMAFPCIFFPSALTNSIASLSLSTVSGLAASHNNFKLRNFCKKSISLCFSVGLLCFLFFLLFGKHLGQTLFNNEIAGKFICTLSFICPFIYVNSAFISILNGLGKTHYSLIINTTGSIIRIMSVFFLIPHFQIQGYLWGLLISHLFISLSSFICYHSLIKLNS